MKARASHSALFMITFSLLSLTRSCYKVMFLISRSQVQDDKDNNTPYSLVAKYLILLVFYLKVNNFNNNNNN